jgi:hypothetical protein
MLDIKSQSQIADAAAEMMRACAFATARAASTSMLQGMSLWSRMLLSPAPQTDAQAEETPAEAPVEAPADPAFASYRSASGHAVAQVILA